MIKKEEKKEEKKVVAAKSDDKQKAIESAVSQIEKQFGKGSIMRLGQSTKFDVDVISTGALSLDLALGVGGVPYGRVIEIFGPEAGGKTTLTLSIISQVQKKGGVAAFIDAEHALDPTYARKLKVNLDDLLISQPDNGEQALDIAEMLVRSNAVDLIVIDSVAALVPQAEIEGAMGDRHIGLQARLMSQALRKLTAIIAKTHTCVIFINQIREKIGVMFGNPETTTGGRALKFYSSVRIDMRNIGAIKTGDKVIGNRVRAKVVKNKVAPPFRNAEFEIIHGEGISREGSVLELGIDLEVLTKSGNSISFGSEKLGVGMESAREFLKSNGKLSGEIEKKIKEALAKLAEEKK